MKKLIQKLHLILGLVAGIVVFIVAITGSITSFEEEIRGMVYSDLMEVKPKGESKPLELLILNAEKFYGKGKAVAIRVKKDKTASVEVGFERKNSVYVNQYTGKVLGKVNKMNDFFGKVLRIHKNLYLKDTGEWITAISSLIMLIMIISGIILWWPTSKRNRKEKFVLKRGLHWKKLNYDLHNVLGFYASFLIIFTVLTALIFSFEWAEKTMFTLTGSKKERRLEVESQSSQLSLAAPITIVYQETIKKLPNYEECIVNIPEKANETYRAMVRYGNAGFFKKQDNLFFDRFDGKLLKERMFDDLSLGMKTRISCEKIHTGKAFGLFGQWAVFFASLIIASMPITGFLIWWNKRSVR